MGNKQFKYLASDLVTELSVPRSTVNDWLLRYGDYLEFELRGKRKVYSEKSLAILKEIQQMRNSGIGLPEAEQKLAEHYGIRPEVSTPSEEEKGELKDTSTTRMTVLPDQNSQLPAVAHSPEELSLQVNDNLSRLYSHIQENAKHTNNIMRDFHYSLLAVTLLIVLSGCLTAAILWLVLVHGAEKLENYYQQTSKKFSDVSSGNALLVKQVGSQQKDIKETTHFLTTTLDNSRKDFAASIQTLRQQLDAQRAAFDERMNSLEKSSEKHFSMELARMRESFALRQKAELTRMASEYESKLNAAANAAAEAETARKAAEDECFELRKKLNNEIAAKKVPQPEKNAGSVTVKPAKKAISVPATPLEEKDSKATEK